SAIILTAEAQKKPERITAYAITGLEKGQRNWTEVNLVDVTTGEVISPVYQSTSEVRRLNARTGKPITQNESSEATPVAQKISTSNNKPVVTILGKDEFTTVTPQSAQGGAYTTTVHTVNGRTTRHVIMQRKPVNKMLPFATTSAACAFDKKNQRLYYTPMGINQLRYIDLKSKNPSVFYFEDEAFGKVSGNGDVNNQITRMVMASDGKGYALTNNAEQLIQFTTKKNPVITNLGPVTDDPSNGKLTVGGRNAYGGDLVADDAGNLILITANRRVYRISIETRVAVYLGSIKGLPEGYTTNGAVVEKEDRIIVTSSTSTKGYYRFDLASLQAEKVSAEGSVFNASDLANANLISTKKKKEEKPTETEKEEVLARETVLGKAVERSIRNETTTEPSLSLYPNPVTNSVTRLSMSDYPEGRYEVQLLDLSGKQVSKQMIQVNSKQQTQEYRLPSQVAKGTYLVRIVNSSNQLMNVEKIIIQ
nr:T9SS type A sorting domain-containing protein [Flavisolibacter sp.]